MNRKRHFIGLALVLVGASLLIVSRLTGLSNFNVVLFTGLLLVIGGAALHVWLQKRDEKY